MPFCPARRKFNERKPSVRLSQPKSQRCEHSRTRPAASSTLLALKLHVSVLSLTLLITSCLTPTTKYFVNATSSKMSMMMRITSVRHHKATAGNHLVDCVTKKTFHSARHLDL